MHIINRSLSLTCLTLLAAGLAMAQAQHTAAPNAEVEALRTSVEQQKAEMDQLREELRRESDLRKKQEELLHTVIQKLNELAATRGQGASETEKTTAMVPVALTTSATDASQAAATSSDTAAKQQKTPNLVENGFGKVRFTGFIHGWMAAGDQGFGNTFRIRRAEMKFSGDLMPKVKWTVMFDLAKALSLNTTSTTVNGTPVIRTASVNQAGRIFQEAYVTLGYHKRANINFGQFKIPLSQEGLQSTSTLDTVERALFMSDRSRGGGLGDNRDIGVMVFGPLDKQLDYQFGVFNGTGESQNDVDQNKQKAIAGRLVFKPSALPGLQIGGSGAWAASPQTTNPRRQRLGGEAVYQRNKVRIKGEFMTGIDGDIHRRGYYGHFGYRLSPKVEAIFRYDVFDPDTGRETTAATINERDFVTGVNYYIKDNNFKLQFNYLRKTFAGSITPDKNLFLVNLQTAW